ncbi:hypothetical protein AURDEDRAFT_109506 [Auricularia subglabra TFB-10046 SS5]|nr:hypothetical protein AURDEDRAFT_109506 [Auricularia subglabra TFB-10046 SS5]
MAAGGERPPLPLFDYSYANFEFTAASLPLPADPDVALSTDPGPALPISAASGHERPATDSEEEGEGARRVKQRKMHPCGMCHKSFDRPSTLRVHQRVHTLEKDYACDKCNKRFSVLSNMKRHAKKCGTVPGAPASGPIGDSTTASSPDTEPSPEPKAKRPRRKGAEPRWIPETLKGYVIGCTWKAPKPLPPITPHQINDTEYEERDSFAVGVPDDPYTDRHWTGRLPGPGLKDVFLGPRVRSAS